MHMFILTSDLGIKLRDLISKIGLSNSLTILLYNIIVIAVTITIAVTAFYIVNYFLKRLTSLIKLENTKQIHQIQHAILRNNVLKKISYFLPLIVIYQSFTLFLINSDALMSVVSRVYNLSVVVLFVIVINAILRVFVEVSQYKEGNRSKPIKGFVQFIQLFIYFFAVIICFSIIISQEPGKLIAGLGALSAIIMLIFKDTITGLVAGIQLSFNNMVKIGDWIEVPKYGVDGDVIDITITSVKVQNWDKTISTIPAYNLVISDSFKNWEGMSASGGRRIARSIYVDMQSVKFCTAEMLERFRKFQHVAAYVDKTEAEIEKFNVEHNVDNSQLVNGRRQTNLGVFRAYIDAYLRNNQDVNQNMTLMVRQLQPTENGIPIQIYCFTATTVWTKYEGIQADIFDHILAVLPSFDLNVYQAPSGSDFKALTS